MIFEEKTIKSDRIYEGSILNLRRDKVTVLHGTSYREIVEHNGGAVLAAITDEGKMVMVRQFRKPAERVMLEVPAGKIGNRQTRIGGGNGLSRPPCAVFDGILSISRVRGRGFIPLPLHRLDAWRNQL